MEKTSHWAALYFVALMTFGNYVLFNLLVAILVEGFSSEVSIFTILTGRNNKTSHFSVCHYMWKFISRDTSRHSKLRIYDVTQMIKLCGSSPYIVAVCGIHVLEIHCVVEQYDQANASKQYAQSKRCFCVNEIYRLTLWTGS